MSDVCKLRVRHRSTVFVAPARLSIVLLLLLYCHPAGAQQNETNTAARAEPPPVRESAPPRFPIPTQWPPFTARIIEVAAEGAVRLRRAEPAARIPLPGRPEITEGWYLGVVKADLGPSLKGARLVRVQVTDVDEKDGWRIQVAEKAAPALETGEILVLIRPTGSTTAGLKQLPDLAPLEEGPSPDALKEQDERTRLAHSLWNLEQIGRAIHLFVRDYRRYPPAFVTGPDGKPWHSWRVLLLPYLDSEDLYRQYKFDEPWDGPNNRTLLARMPAVYSDPTHGPNERFYAHYVAITGHDMAFTADGVEFFGDDIAPALRGGRSLNEFHDGARNTLLVGPAGPEHKIPWMKPKDIVVGQEPAKLGTRGSFAAPYRTGDGNAAPFLWGSGVAAALLDTIESKTFRALLTIDGDETVGAYPHVMTPRGGNLEPVIYILGSGKKTVARLVHEPVEVPKNPEFLHPAPADLDRGDDEPANDPFGVRRGPIIRDDRARPQAAPK
jgi:hypothetical protein